MFFGKLLHWLVGRPQVLTIDLIASDRMALGMKIMDLDNEKCAALNWSQDERQKLYDALMARSPKGYDGWHPTDEKLSTVTLAKTEWVMVERLCSELVSPESEGWPSRVLSQIRAKAD